MCARRRERAVRQIPHCKSVEGTRRTRGWREREKMEKEKRKAKAKAKEEAKGKRRKEISLMSQILSTFLLDSTFLSPSFSCSNKKYSNWNLVSLLDQVTSRILASSDGEREREREVVARRGFESSEGAISILTV